MLGEIEEYFIEGLIAGDTFVFAGEVVRFEGWPKIEAYVSRANDEDPKMPSYMGGKFPLSTYLAERVREHARRPARAGTVCPTRCATGCRCSATSRACPARARLLVETFPRGNQHYLVCYPFEGRLAHQTLGMLLTRRLERAGAQPLGFVATEYALAIWGLATAR